MIAIVNRSRHQLGAEELLELGRSAHGIKVGNAPFFSARPCSPRLGNIFVGGTAAPAPAASGVSIPQVLTIGIPVAVLATVLVMLSR